MNPRILGAFLVGAGLIAFAYYYSPIHQPADDASLAVVAGPAPIRGAISIGDSDNDGIPDWQEEFRRTEPIRLAQKEEVATYTPPQTLTDTLAIELFEGSVLGNTPSTLGRSQEELLRYASAEIEKASQDTLYTLRDLVLINDSSTERLRVYGNRVAAIALQNGVPVGSRSELTIIEHALRASDESVLAELDARIEAYGKMVEEMHAVEVPSVVAERHLNLLNAYNALYEDLKGMRAAFSDPLYTMVRLKRYYDDVMGTMAAISDLYETLYDRGARFEEGDMTLSFVIFEE